MKSNRFKLRELILQIAGASQRGSALSVGELNRLLFLVDFEAYRTTGASISGQEYVRTEDGPEMNGIAGVIDRMEARGDIQLYGDRHDPPPLRRVTHRREGRADCFGKAEIEAIRRVFERCQGKSDTELNEMSRESLGWQTAENGGAIPYETAWLSTRPLTPRQLAKGRELADRYGVVERTRSV